MSSSSYAHGLTENKTQTADRHQKALNALLSKGTPLTNLATKLEYQKQISLLKRKEVDADLLEHTKKLAKQHDVHEAIQEAKAIL